MTTRTEASDTMLQSGLQYLRRNRRFLLPRNWLGAIKILYKKRNNSGIFDLADDMEGCSLLPARTLDLVLQLFQPRSVLDVGCGTGQSLGYYLRYGIDAWGVEGSKAALFHSKYRSRIIRHDLRESFSMNRMFDLVWSYEVAEHINADFVDVFVDTLMSHAPIVVMSAAPPGQGGNGHVNEQPKSYWISLAAKRGFDFDEDASRLLGATGEPYSENCMVFRRRTLTDSI